MSATPRGTFHSSDLLAYLAGASDTALDALECGVIGFDAQGIVRRYNRFESVSAGLSPDKVVGHALFSVVAPLAAPALRRLRPRQTCRVQLQAPGVLPLVRGAAHGADCRSPGRQRHPARAGAPVGAVTADPAATAAGRTTGAGDAGATGRAPGDHAPPAGSDRLQGL